MRTSEKVSAITAAIAQVQHAIEPITKNKTVKVDGDKAKWESAYATLGELSKAAAPHMKAAGIAKIQGVAFVPTLGAVLVTRLALGDEWIEADYPIKESRPGAQGFGGGISFAKRWAICGMLDLVPDDVEEGMGYKDARAAARPPRRAAAPGGIGDALEAITSAASCETLVAAARKARATHPTGEASAAVEKRIEAWFVATCDMLASVDALQEVRDAANTVKPRGSEVRLAIQRAAVRVGAP
jgi:hypothetical protein